jgi:hypothetical protein
VLTKYSKKLQIWRFGMNRKNYVRKKNMMAATAATTVLVGVISPTAYANTKVFTDVFPSDYFYQAVNDLSARGVLAGYTDGTFKPNQQLTRAEAAKIIAYALGLDTDQAIGKSFSDVPKNYWAAKSIATLSEANIIAGYVDGTFKPDAPITRAELAKMLVYAYQMNGEASIPFEDVKDTWYTKVISTLVYNNVTDGKSPSIFAPDDYVTRGEMAAFIQKSEKVIPETGQVQEIKDNSIVINDRAYQLTEELQNIFVSNKEVLKNAAISFTAENNKITSIKMIEIIASGTEDQPLVFAGQNLEVKEKLIVSGNYLTLQNIEVKGDFILTGEGLLIDAVTVDGDTEVNDGTSTMSVSGNNSIQNKENSITFNNVSMNRLSVNNTIYLKVIGEETRLSEIEVNKDAKIYSLSSLVLPKLTVAEGVNKLELDASFESVTLNTQTLFSLVGTSVINQLILSGLGEVLLEIKGEIGKLQTENNEVKLTLNKDIVVKDISLPAGTKISDLIKNYDDIKENIENIDGSKNPDAGSTTPDNPPGSGGGTPPVNLTENYVLETIKNATSVTQIKSLLDNSRNGLDLTDYKTLTTPQQEAIQNDLISKEFTTKTEVENKIKNYIVKTDEELVSALTDSNTKVVILGKNEFSLNEQAVVATDKIIIGSGITSIVKLNMNTGTEHDARAAILFKDTSEFTLQDIRFDGAGSKLYQAVRSYGTGLIKGCTFDNIQYNASGPNYQGIAVVGYGNLTVQKSVFKNIGRVGISLFGPHVDNGSISENEFIGKGEGNWLDYAVELGGGAKANILNNVISDNKGVAEVDRSGSAGILITTYFSEEGDQTTAIIKDNVITNSTIGIAVGYAASDFSKATIVDNHFSQLEHGVSVIGDISPGKMMINELKEAETIKESIGGSNIFDNSSVTAIAEVELHNLLLKELNETISGWDSNQAPSMMLSDIFDNASHLTLSEETIEHYDEMPFDQGRHLAVAIAIKGAQLTDFSSLEDLKEVIEGAVKIEYANYKIISEVDAVSFASPGEFYDAVNNMEEALLLYLPEVVENRQNLIRVLKEMNYDQAVIDQLESSLYTTVLKQVNDEFINGEKNLTELAAALLLEKKNHTDSNAFYGVVTLAEVIDGMINQSQDDSDPLLSHLTATFEHETRITVSFKLSEEILLDETGLGNVIIKYGTKDMEGNFAEASRAENGPIAKNKYWDSYLNDADGSQYGFNTRIPADTLLSTTVDKDFATMSYADQVWYNELLRGNAYVRLEVTDNAGNQTIQDVPLAFEGTIIQAQDFGVLLNPGLGIKGYTAGLKLNGITAGDLASVEALLYKEGRLLQKNTATNALITEFADSIQLSSPFDVDGTYGDSYWNYGDWLGDPTDIADQIVFIVKDQNNRSYRVENNTLTGDTTPLQKTEYADAEAYQMVEPQDFGVMQFSGINGYTVGFKLPQSTNSVVSAKIKLLSSSDELLGEMNSNTIFEVYGDSLQFSAPFDVNGGAVYDDLWSYSGWLGSTNDVPAKAVIIITDVYGDTYTVENNNLTGDPERLTMDSEEELLSYLATANQNDIFFLGQDIQLSSTLTIDKGIVLDGNGFTLDASDVNGNVAINLSGEGVTIKEINLNSNQSDGAILIGAKNVKVMDNTINYLASSTSGAGIVTLYNGDSAGTIIKDNELHVTKGMGIYLNPANDDGVMDVKNNRLFGNSAFAGIGIDQSSGGYSEASIFTGNIINEGFSIAFDVPGGTSDFLQILETSNIINN